MNFSMIMAAFWLVVALGMFSYPLLQPQGGHLNIGGTGIPFAWVAVFFACYNMLRGWLIRVRKRESEVLEHPAGRRRPATDERNPDFDFSEETGAGDKPI